MLAGDEGLQVVGDRQVGAVGPAGGLGLVDELGDRGPREELEADEVDDGRPVADGADHLGGPVATDEQIVRPELELAGEGIGS